MQALKQQKMLNKHEDLATLDYDTMYNLIEIKKGLHKPKDKLSQ